MNKKMLLGAATALSMVVGSTAAFAGPSDKVVFGGSIDWNGPFPGGNVNANVPIDTSTLGGAIIGGLATAVNNAIPNPDNRLARYEQNSNVNGNTDGNQAAVTARFTLAGTVTKDCSFYSGDSTVSGGVFNQTIQLGTIGVQTGNNVNSSLAFDQNGPITANISTSTAGCNTANTVTVSKLNGTAGLKNPAPGSYDSNQFTDVIPYTVVATWTGVDSGVAIGGTKTITVAANDDTETRNQGAWRSSFDMTINAPAPTKGLVAGTYTDAVTVTLAAL